LRIHFSVAIISKNSELVDFAFYYNFYSQIHGTIPTELGRLSSLTTLLLGKLEMLRCFFGWF
jgi:hypothetical protein